LATACALAAEARARTHQVSDDQADHKRERRDDLEIDQGFDADAADFLGILDMRDSGNHRAEDNRRDHHLDQLDEAVPERLDPIVRCIVRCKPAEQRAEHDRNQHLNIENPVPGLCRANWCCFGCDCCHDDPPIKLADLLKPPHRVAKIN
jgi:hypothetical protein